MADKRRLEGQKARIVVAVIVTAIVLALVAIVVYQKPAAPTTGKTLSPEASPASSTTQKPAATENPAAPTTTEGPYKGWQTYSNTAMGVSSLYPPGWTIDETADRMRATFVGPALPAGPITNEGTASIFVETVPPATKLAMYVSSAQGAPGGGGDVTSKLDTSLDSNAAIEVVDTYAIANQPWKRMRVWTIKNGKAVTFTYVADLNFNTIDYYTKHETEAEQIRDSITIR
jgi:hypothetical protein